MGRFDEIKVRISARQAAERYGVEVNRQGKARCIWHGPDRHPSLSFKDGYCHCFTCGNGGSCIDLTAALFGLSVTGAADKLNEDFNLGLEGSGKTPAAIIRQHEQDKVLVEAFQRWEAGAIRTMTNYFRLLHRAQILLAPNTAEEELHPLFVESLQRRETVEYYLDALEHGTMEEKVDFYRKCREVVSRNGQRLRYWRTKGFIY